MICGPLEIPDEVVAALGAGKLVIFAGAGISCGGRSNLRSFVGLTEQVRMRLGKPQSATKQECDVLLGDWKGLGGDVHDITREIIAASPGHNPIHEYLLQLFPRDEDIRIVTTNFDRHFRSAAEALGKSLPIYRAPALPLGRDFHGLVYLHGCVDDRADRLVLTDADFGRAYLSEGWARTFLQSLYAEFNVLFVGFSHDDVLLTYLAKGLSPHGPTKRHAFQLRGEEKKWDRIHVSPIPYGQPPSPADAPADHSDLGKGVLRWVELLRLKPSDEMGRVRSIISRTESPAVSIGGESTLVPSGDAKSISGFRLSLDDEDFLRRILGDPQKNVWFIETAKDLRWVAWALEARLLGSLADPQVRAINPVPPSVMLSRWAINLLIANPVPGALELFAKLGGRFGPDAWQHSVWRLTSLLEQDPPWASPHLDLWLVSIRHGCSNLRQHDVTCLTRLIVRLANLGFNDHAVGLFARLLQVRVEWRAPLAYLDIKDQWSPQGTLTGDLQSLKDVWSSLAALRNQAEHRIRLFRILSKCVEELYAACCIPTGNWDPLAGLRIVVDEPRNEYDPSSSEAFVVEMLCQLIKAQATEPDGIAEHQILIWLESDRLLWRRLGYLALREDLRITPAAKAKIILDLKLIHPLRGQLQHDPQALVTKLYGSLSPADKIAILDAVADVPIAEPLPEETAEDNTRWALRIRDGFLNRLALAHPEDSEIIAIFERLSVPLPSIQAEPEGPWPDGEMRELNQSPVPPSEIIKRPAHEQLDEIIGFKSEQAWDVTSRDGYFTAAISAAKQNVEWAKSLLTALAQRKDSAAFWARLGWDCPWLREDGAFRRWFLLELFPSIHPSNWNFDSYRAWSSCLLGLADRPLDPVLAPDEWVVLTEWSAKLWSACGPQAGEKLEKRPAAEAHSRAINHPIGPVIEFWLSSASQLRRNDASAPHEWSAVLKPLVDDLLSRDDDYRLMTLSLFGQQLRFLRYAFPDWTHEVIYPRFHFSADPEQALCLWKSWLNYGNISLELAQELPPLFTANHTRLLSADDSTSRRFLGYMAAIATSIAAPSNTLSWVLEILGDATPKQRAWWTTEVASVVRGKNEAQQRQVWDSWAKDYLLRFRQGAFGDPALEDAKDEFWAFLHWPIAFSAIGDAVLDGLQAMKAWRIEQLDVIYEIKQIGLATKAPDLVARYLRWTLVDVGADRWGFYGLDDVLTDIVVTGRSRSDLEQVSEKLLVMQMRTEREILAAKLAAFDAGQGPQNPPPSSDSPAS